VSRRARAIAFAALALACAGLAAAVASGYRGGIEAQLGPLRPVVMAAGELEERRPVTAQDAADLLEVRRVPERFAPPDGLTDPRQAIGREPLTSIPAGAYVTAGLLRAPSPGNRQRPIRALKAGGEAVEVTVTGAAALAAGGSDPTGEAVDVVVTTEPGPGGGAGRTYVAAEGVHLLALSEGDASGGDIAGAGPAAWVATLAVSRAQALRLIHAQNFAREVRLIGSAG
jgi:Flp pilus assembly protein CpaB